MVTRCTINKSGSRGLWASTSSHKILYEDNYVSLTRAGLDCDFHTFGAVAMFNTFANNTYGLWYEQGAQHNTGIGNTVTNSDRDNLDAGNLNQSQVTEYNSFICNFAGEGGNGLINSAGSDGNTFTSHNFFFNNVILNATITSSGAGTENYYSQNYHSGGTFTSSSAATYFNSSDVDSPDSTGSIFSGNYQLQNEASGLVLNNQGSLTNGTAITQWSSVSSDNLRWTFIPTDSGYYQIQSVKSGLDAVVQSASTAQGAGIIQWSFGSAQNDQWLPQQNSDGSYTFVNRHSGLALEDPGSSTATTTQMDQWGANGGANQKWKLIPQ